MINAISDSKFLKKIIFSIVKVTKKSFFNTTINRQNTDEIIEKRILNHLILTITSVTHFTNQTKSVLNNYQLLI